MSQIIIDNAAAISLDRDLTVSSTTSQSRRLKYFRKGPFQTRAEIQMNVVKRSIYQALQSVLSDQLLGPYNIKFPAEVVGDASPHTITVNGASQTGNSVSISSVGNTTVIAAGAHVHFEGVTTSFVATNDVTTDSSGIATVNLDQPLPSSPTNAGDVDVGADITFNMYVIERPRASFGTTGLVNHDGSFIMVENV